MASRGTVLSVDTERPRQATVVAPHRQRIALVDDTGRGVTQLERGVHMKGYTPLLWRWGNGLHAMLQRERPDLVIVEFPAAKHCALGLAIRQVRRDPVIGQTPFILLVEGAAHFPRSLGHCTVACRPIDRWALYAIIADLIGPPPAPPHKHTATC